MSIQFDEVVGEVKQGGPEGPAPGPEKMAETPAKPPVDPDRLRRELALFEEREARLRAD